MGVGTLGHSLAEPLHLDAARPGLHREPGGGAGTWDPGG